MPRLVMLSANHPELSTQLHERIYSSLLPSTVYLEPYTEDEAVRILETRVEDWLNKHITAAALAHIAASSPNIQLGRH